MRFSKSAAAREYVDFRRLQGVLIEAAADLAADAHQRRVLQIGADSRDGVELRAQALDHLFRRGLPGLPRLEAHKDTACIGAVDAAAPAPASSDAGGERLHAGVLGDDVCHKLLGLHHGVERDVLWSFG
jgi:hypothetical protein